MKPLSRCPSCDYKGVFPIPIEANENGARCPETWIYCRRCDMNYGDEEAIDRDRNADETDWAYDWMRDKECDA